MGMAEYSFTQVSGSMRLVSTSEASRYYTLTDVATEAINAISAISGHGSLPSAYAIKSAAFFNQLASALNAVT